MLSIASITSTSMVMHTPPTRMRAPSPRCFFPAPAETEDKPFCYGLSGNNFPVLGGNFDPLYFTDGKDELEVKRLREAELVHSRVGIPSLPHPSLTCSFASHTYPQSY